LKEKITFIAVGVLNTFFSFVINFTLYKLFKSDFGYRLIVFVSTVVSLFFNFFSYNLILYKKFDNLKIRIIRFFVLGSFLTLINLVVFIFFHETLKISYEITILISLAISIILSYSSNKFFIFNNINYINKIDI
jgi:putative flippase GtrA